MKTIHLLSTAAAALLITAGTASAQNDSVGAAPAPPAIQNAPAEKIAPPMNAGERKAPETTGAGPDLKFGERETSGQGSKPLDLGSGGNTELKDSAGADTRAGDPGAKAGADVKAQRKSGESAAGDKSSSSGESAADDKSGSAQQSSQSDSAQTTTGQGAAAGAAKLSTEQKSQITAAIQQQQDVKALESSEVNFTVSVGAEVPRHLHFYPVPQRVVQIYPAWEGYRFILVGGQILIIDPDAYVIVAVLAV